MKAQRSTEIFVLLCAFVIFSGHSIEMQSAFIHYQGSDMHYVRYGTGDNAIVCFHGYGESTLTFGCLVSDLPGNFSLIAIDLPFHGLTTWRAERPITVEDLVAVIDTILMDHKVGYRKFILIGFSMGARIAMSILQHIPTRIKRLVLLAPDGMKVNCWYWLATQTRHGRHIFRFIMKHPKLLSRPLNGLSNAGLVNKSLLKFINAYIGSPRECNELFNRWTFMRTFKPDLKKLSILIKENKIPIRFLYGEHDRIILAKKSKIFHKRLQSFCEIKIINAGHQVLHKKYAAEIMGLLVEDNALA